MTDLGIVPGSSASVPMGINGDGSAIVGYSNFITSLHAFLWTPALGMVDLQTYLPTLGIDLTNWTLTNAIAVSDDGRTIVGRGGYDAVPGPGGNIGLGWVVTIPSPTAAPGLVFAGLLTLARRRRSVYATTTCVDNQAWITSVSARIIAG